MSETVLSPSHFPLAPKTEEQQVSWIRLLRSRRVGASTFHRLMAEHDWDADAAIRDLPRVAREAGMEGYAPCTRDTAKAEYRAARMAGATMIAYGMAQYPANLAHIKDAPPFLWAIGNTAILSRPMIAVVGARNASSLGQRMARKLVEGLGEAGFVIVSGLAHGIDTVAHHTSLSSGTVAVHAGGVDVIYPRANSELALEIGKSGLRISENPMGYQPQARHFPTRNRIISGLCQGVVVVEAAAKSGSLITARAAADQGRDVFAVPGHPFDVRASGSNALLRDGATLVRGAEDVLAEIRSIPQDTSAEANLPFDPPPEPEPASAPAPALTLATGPSVAEQPLRQTAKLHAEILHRLSPSPIPEDQLIRDIKEKPEAVIAQLTELELSGKIERKGGLLSLGA